MNRLEWKSYYMGIADLTSARSSCLRRKVGAVIVKDHKIISVGYNSVPSLCRECKNVGCLRETMNIPSGERQELCRAIHAEQMAIINAGCDLLGAELFVTTHPCSICAKLLASYNFSKVYYLGDYADDLAKSILRESGIQTYPCNSVLGTQDVKIKFGKELRDDVEHDVIECCSQKCDDECPNISSCKDYRINIREL